MSDAAASFAWSGTPRRATRGWRYSAGLGGMPKILNRRDLMRLAGMAGAAALAACAPARRTRGERAVPSPASPTAAGAAVPSCVVRPALTEGPFFVDEKLNRSDIRSDPSDGSVRPGVPLALAFTVSKVASGSCTALQGATVDVWHCDAAGEYSDVAQNGTSGRKFLRGYQVTDGAGRAAFTTIYPGWYQGRAVHIHFKIRTFAGPQKTYEFTSQLFFDDAPSDQVYARSPYDEHGRRDTRNVDDGIFRGGGRQLVLRVTKDGDGYASTFDIGLRTA